MPRPLNNYQTVDTYVAAGLVIFSPPVDSFTMIVTGAAVDYQVAASTGNRHADGENPGPETFCPPGRYTFDAADSQGLGGNGKLAFIQVRSAVAGTPAQVTVQG